MAEKNQGRMGVARHRATLLGLSLLFALLFIHCGKTGTEPGGPEIPTKLYPYEIAYDSAAFKSRRDRLAQSLPPGSAIVLATHELFLRNGDVQFVFRPASTFYYLTGFEEANAAAIIRPRGDSGSEFILFVGERDSAATQLLGPAIRTSEAMKYFGADTAYGIASLPTYIQANLAAGQTQAIYSNASDNEAFATTLDSAVNGVQVLDVIPKVDSLRFIKDEREIQLIQKSVDVSVQAFKEGIRSVKAGKYEFEVEAVFDLVSRLNGCPRTAFTTIIASGPNSETIHYTANNRQMRAGDLVLIDFGTEYGYYAADLARTVPVNGAFTPEQAAVYDIILKTQDSVMSLVKPGVDFYGLFKTSASLLIEGLLRQGVISGDKDEIMASNRYLEYAPTGLGHPVGLDVHDPVAFNPEGIPVLSEGVILALEPGIYLKSNDLSVTEGYRGICIRLEDDVRVTASGYELLSRDLPRAREEIEALVRGK